MQIIDVAITSAGRRIVVTDEGQIFTEDAPNGVAFAHLPESQRPKTIWREIEPPDGVVPVKAIGGQYGSITLLASGRLFERERDPNQMIGIHYRWVELSPGEPYVPPVNPPVVVRTEVLRVSSADGKPLPAEPTVSDLAAENVSLRQVIAELTAAAQKGKSK